MRHLLIVFDSVRYDRFLEADTPNLDGLGEAVLGWTHGSWTRPSMISILSGYLPYSKEYGQPYHPSWLLLGKPMFKNEEVPVWFFNANDWIHKAGPSVYREIHYTKKYQAKKMVENAEALMEAKNNFFVIMLFAETHMIYQYQPAPPSVRRDGYYRNLDVVDLFTAYNSGVDNEAPKVAAERSRKAISYLDGVVEPLLYLANRVTFTSDHGELQGENHVIGHDPGYAFHPILFQVPLIVGDY